MSYPQNTPSVDDMLNMGAGELPQMPVQLLAGLQAETAQYMERCQSAGRSFSDCALTASGR